MSRQYDYMYSVVGVIPHHVGDMKEEDIDVLHTLAKENEKVVAIGEIGLDYYYDEPARDIIERISFTSLKVTSFTPSMAT